MAADTLIVISGGGLAQVESATGCLMALAESGVPVMDAGQVCWRGTSAGAIVSAMCAAGWHPDRMAGYLSERKTADLLAKRWDWLIRGAAILCHVSYGPIYQRQGTEALLHDVLWGDEVSLPSVTVVYTRLRDGRRVEAAATYSRVLASSAIPGIFAPVMTDGELATDGGDQDNVPISPWHPQVYRRVYLILPPADPTRDRHYSSTIGRILRSFDAKLSQEVDEAERIYGSGYYNNVTVLRPNPIESSLLSLSPGRRVMLHSYHWTMARLGV